MKNCTPGYDHFGKVFIANTIENIIFIYEFYARVTKLNCQSHRTLDKICQGSPFEERRRR